MSKLKHFQDRFNSSIHALSQLRNEIEYDWAMGTIDSKSALIIMASIDSIKSTQALANIAKDN